MRASVRSVSVSDFTIDNINEISIFQFCRLWRSDTVFFSRPRDDQRSAFKTYLAGMRKITFPFLRE
jgi:hypothetical protein